MVRVAAFCPGAVHRPRPELAAFVHLVAAVKVDPVNTGFGIISGIDLPGEARGDVKKPNEFTEGTQQFMAFGLGGGPLA